MFFSPFLSTQQLSLSLSLPAKIWGRQDVEIHQLLTCCKTASLHCHWTLSLSLLLLFPSSCLLRARADTSYQIQNPRIPNWFCSSEKRGRDFGFRFILFPRRLPVWCGLNVHVINHTGTQNIRSKLNPCQRVYTLLNNGKEKTLVYGTFRGFLRGWEI